MSNNFSSYMTERIDVFNDKLDNYLKQLNIPSYLKESMNYSIKAGGKRVRPILVIASLETYNENTNKAMATACALEMIHTYSLIHDDLPAMDNDDYRRGKLTNHKVFDEATAILAGDALLTYAFEIIANDEFLTDKEKVYIMSHLSYASGPKGMIAGQILDIEAENKMISLDELINIHTKKTGALIKFSVHAGAYLGGATKTQLKYLDEFSENLGLLFQVQDDILDIVGDEDKLGKPVGSDEENEKSTYPSLLGLDKAQQYRNMYAKEARLALTKANANNYYLTDLINFIAKRDH